MRFTCSAEIELPTKEAKVTVGIFYLLKHVKIAFVMEPIRKHKTSLGPNFHLISDCKMRFSEMMTN